MPKGVYKHKNGYKRPPFSEKWKKRMSKSLKGKHNSPKTEFKKGEISAFKGHKHTKESKEKNSKSHLGNQTARGKHWKMSEKYRGKNHPNWIDGRTPENEKIRRSMEFRLWREAVFARDNWTCQKYGIKGGRLHPHHIKNFSEYPELRFAVDNGITFSEKAHKEFHKKYGIKNNTKEQLEEFLKC